MYVKRIYLKNIRCFERFEINFDKLGSSILVLGDNGDGKSTLLRSLAMGLCDESSASALFRELPGEFVRKNSNEDEGKIEIDLSAGGGVTYKITTIIKSLDTFERVSQFEKNGCLFKIKGNTRTKLNQDTFPWEKIFVSGYGAGIRVNGIADFQHYLAVDAVYPLFKYDVFLQNPELVLRRLVESQETSTKRKTALKTITCMLKEILKLEEQDEIYLSSTGIKVKGRWGEAELGELGDGYRSVVTWVLDLISWWFLKNKTTELKDIKGVVLIDEIEQHLHPRWQIEIMTRLHKSFPKLQFIATTHSPLVVSGCKHCRVFSLKNGVAEETKSAYGWLPEDVYREVMGVSETRASEFIDIINDYRELYNKELSGKQLSRSEKQRRRNIKRDLGKQLPEGDPIAVTAKINSITEYLRKIRNK